MPVEKSRNEERLSASDECFIRKLAPLLEQERNKPSLPDFSLLHPVLRRQAMKAWREGDIIEVMSSFGSHKHFDFLESNYIRLLIRGLYEKAFVTAYTSINLNAGELPSKSILKRYLTLANRERLQEAGDPLPTKGAVKVYRGVGYGGNPEYIRGLSWTASPAEASWFAHYWARRYINADPAVYEYTAKPDQIYFYINDRDEQEYVVNIPPNARPRRLPQLPEPRPQESVEDAVRKIRKAMAEEKDEDPAFKKVRQYAESKFGCGTTSVHGLLHWRRVAFNGELLCSQTKADITVVRLFAYLHDAWRLDDGDDLDHGRRSADRLAEIPPSVMKVRPSQMRLLDYAIRHHTDGSLSDDKTIGTCWDADRLDLGRVGIVPDAKFMSTKRGKELTKGV